MKWNVQMQSWLFFHIGFNKSCKCALLSFLLYWLRVSLIDWRFCSVDATSSTQSIVSPCNYLGFLLIYDLGFWGAQSIGLVCLTASYRIGFGVERLWFHRRISISSYVILGFLPLVLNLSFHQVEMINYFCLLCSPSFITNNFSQLDNCNSE